MKKHYLLASAALLSAFSLSGENFFPNGSFEGAWRPVWNRLNCESYLGGTPHWSLVKGDKGNCLQSDLSGTPLELQFEGSSVTGSSFSLDLKGSKKGQSVLLTWNTYYGLKPLVLLKTTLKVSDSWQRFTVRLPRDNRMRYRGMAPFKVTLTPAKGEQLAVDNVKYEYSLKPVLSKVRKTVPIPSIAKGAAALGETIPFTVKHYGKTAANVPFTVVLPFASGKFRCAADWAGVQVRSEQGKLFPAQGRVISRWPADNSVRALAVDAVADLKAGVNKMTAVKGTLAPPMKTRLYPVTITAADAEGNWYKSVFTPADIEFSGPVRKVVSGWTELKAKGKPSIPVQCRMSYFKGIPDAEIEVSLCNPYENRPFVLSEAYVTLDSGKQVKQYTRSLAVRQPKKDAPKASISVQGPGTIIMPQMNERHPAEIVARDGKFSIALWPRSVRQLAMSSALVLTRRFIWSPDPKAVSRFGNERTIAMVAPARYGETKFFLLPLGAVDRKNYPFAAKKIDATFQFRYSKAGQVKASQDGVFDYGDLPGDGGWSNLESFRDYGELMRAVVCGDHDLLNFAYDRAIHYRDIDTFRGNSLYHAGNHVGGGFSYSHSWPQGIIYHYLMTGDPRSKQVVEEAAGTYYSVKTSDPDVAGARSLSRYLLGLADFYGALGQKKLKDRFFAQVKHAEKTNLKPDRADNTLFPWGDRLDPYQVWYGACAFMEMYFLTGEKQLLDWFRREMAASLNKEFFYLDLKELWPGVPPEKGWPIQLGFHSRHRGSLLYPVLLFLAQIDNKPELVTLAQRAAYSDWCAGAGYGGDSLEYFRLCALTGGIPEAKLVADAQKLVFDACAAEIPNGDMSKSKMWFTHWNLHGLRQMGFDSAVETWPLVANKDFKRLSQERANFARYVSPWRYYARLLGYLDHQDFGKAAPSLNVRLSSSWVLGRTAVVAGANVKLTPGKWRWRASYKIDKSLGTQSFARLVVFVPGGTMQFHSIVLAPTGKSRIMNNGPAKSSLRNMKLAIKQGAKPGWKELDMTFEAPFQMVARPLFYLYLAPGGKDSWIRLDDIKLEKM